MSVINTELLAKKLREEHGVGIKPTDPAFLFLSLNSDIMKSFTDTLIAKQEENLNLCNAAMEQHVQKSKDVASGLIQNAGMHVAKYIQEVTLEGEAQVREAAQRAKSDLEQSLWATKIGGYLFLIAASIFLGMALCTLLMPLLPHKG